MSDRSVVLDIETQNTFQEVGKYDHTLLKVSFVGAYDFATDTYHSYFEADLPMLWRLMEHADRIIGYNNLGFDQPVLNNYYPGDLLKLASLDIMGEIEKKIGFRVKLDDVAQATLGIGKSGTGLMAIEFYRKGELDKLRDYCLQDVKVTKDVYLYGLQNKEVFFNDRQGRRVAVPVDFSLPQAKSVVNLTMPF